MGKQPLSPPPGLLQGGRGVGSGHWACSHRQAPQGARARRRRSLPHPDMQNHLLGPQAHTGCSCTQGAYSTEQRHKQTQGPGMKEEGAQPPRARIRRHPGDERGAGNRPGAAVPSTKQEKFLRGARCVNGERGMLLPSLRAPGKVPLSWPLPVFSKGIFS